MLYAILRAIICWWARWYLRLEVVGREHVPASGGLLVASNHVSYLDIPMLACALGRRADFMGKRELFHHPIVGRVYRHLGGFPIRRGGVTKDALHEAIRRLRGGRAVVIYPEGQISLSGELLPPKPGIGVLVARSGVPVLPAYVAGTDEAMPRGRRWVWPRPVKVVLGRPLTFGPEEEAAAGGAEDADASASMREQQRIRYAEISQRVMQAITALQAQSQQTAAVLETARGAKHSGIDKGG
ncbi:MAG: lysophospholipid acyltransferase family protein [Nitrospirota bacterium]